MSCSHIPSLDQFHPKNPHVFSPVSHFFQNQPSSVLIYLKRNALDRFLSFEREHKLNSPHCMSDCDISKVHDMTFHINEKKLLTFLDDADDNDKLALSMLRGLGRPVLEVHSLEVFMSLREQTWDSSLASPVIVLMF